MIRNKQLSLDDIYEGCQHLAVDDKPAFIKLLEEHLDISKYIPICFYDHYQKRLGRKRGCSLESFVYAFIIQMIFGISDISTLRLFLSYSKPLREFCGFTYIPDASKFTRFKQDFCDDLELLFHNLVDITQPICDKLNPELSSALIFDTTGIEAYVTENNPKYLNKIILQLKPLAKNNPTFDPYKAAYVKMPKHSLASDEIKQLYINGHFCYVYKYGILTNGLGIVRHISLIDSDFKSKHLSPDTDKSVGDATALKPVLTDFFAHHSFKYNTFIGDSAFDTTSSYQSLLKDFKFTQAIIPLNSRNQKYALPGFNEYGHPLCPDDLTPMLYEGVCRGKNRPTRDKWWCPKGYTKNGVRYTTCENPCTSSKCGRMFYTYPENDLRLYPGIVRDIPKWDKLYHVRPVIEQTINQFKEHMGISVVKSRDKRTINANMLFAGITQLITLILADTMGEKKHFKSLRRLIA